MEKICKCREGKYTKILIKRNFVVDLNAVALLLLELLFGVVCILKVQVEAAFNAKAKAKAKRHLICHEMSETKGNLASHDIKCDNSHEINHRHESHHPASEQASQQAKHKTLNCILCLNLRHEINRKTLERERERERERELKHTRELSCGQASECHHHQLQTTGIKCHIIWRIKRMHT